ncbi:unnamed protein product [Trichobilharzia regenti]|nr:unnamed protein product [Trichobilharzia regenti]
MLFFAGNTVSNSVDYLDDENPTEEGLHVKTEDIHINPIDGSDKVRSPWHTKRSNQKKLKSPKSIRYKNRLRNIVNNNNNNNKTDLLCNGLSPSRNDSILSKKSDCLPNLYADQRLLNADTECYNGTNDYLLRHEQDIDVSLPFSPRRRNTFPAHLLSDNERRSSESIGGLTNLHQPSLWHDQFSPNHLSVSNCNGDTKLLADYSEKHKSLLMNGDSSLSQVHNENLIEHNLSRDKLNLSCNSLHEDYERSQVSLFSFLFDNVHYNSLKYHETKLVVS